MANLQRHMAPVRPQPLNRALLLYSCSPCSLSFYSCLSLGACWADMPTSGSSVQFSSVTPSCPTLCNPMDCSNQASLPITNSQSLLKLVSIESVMPSNHLILCHPLLLLPLIFPSIRVFCNESVLCIRWPKYWSFNFSISPSNEYSGLISFRMDWLDLQAYQGTLKSLLQHPSSKASVLWCSVFFTVQLSHPYMTTGKLIALTRWTSAGKIMSLLFNTLSRLVLTFLLGLGTTLFYKLCWPCSPKLDVFPGSSSRQGAMIILLMIQVEDFFFLPYPATCRILVPQQAVEPMPPCIRNTES